MPTSANSDRVWIAGGAAVALLLLVLGYLLLISPQNADTAALGEQAAAEHQRVASLEKHLADLRKQNAHLDEYKAKLTADKLALPANPDSDAFLVELRAVADHAGVVVDSMSAGAGPKSKTGSTYTVPVAVTVVGPAKALQDFLTGVQQTGSRAALVTSVSASGAGSDGAAPASIADQGTTMTVSMTLFTAPGVIRAATT
jgi:Tfp pilus assembly protein PilO